MGGWVGVSVCILPYDYGRIGTYTYMYYTVFQFFFRVYSLRLYLFALPRSSTFTFFFSGCVGSLVQLMSLRPTPVLLRSVYIYRMCSVNFVLYR